MALNPHLHSSGPQGRPYPPEGFLCDPHMGMLPFHHAHYQPIFPWPDDSDYQTPEAMQLTRSFGSDCV
ncbi:hypothetical protein K431DRAFT_288988 [Polychaeton citri CBS 116435]|uniref:Uncharacterized protein n=1 Tax=Polychaeton citri CBS 116435 TaxID=1314669 RepID=A0A9P4Q027_9PEZI|nr:hypothetical protein K431DRAFT_288988 [Polychaeton citri CBS 116435]